MNSLLFLSPGLALITHTPHAGVGWRGGVGGQHHLLYLHLPESQLKLFPWTSSNSCTAIKALIWKSLNSMGFEASQHICFIPVEMMITLRIVVGILVRCCWWWETNIQGNFHKIVLGHKKKQTKNNQPSHFFFFYFSFRLSLATFFVMTVIFHPPDQNHLFWGMIAASGMTVLSWKYYVLWKY